MRALNALLCAVLVAVACVGCPPSSAILRVVNESSKTIVEVNCVLASDPGGWGDNLVAEDVGPGEECSVSGFDAGTYTARVVSSEGAMIVAQPFELRVGQTYTWTIYDSGD